MKLLPILIFAFVVAGPGYCGSAPPFFPDAGVDAGICYEDNPQLPQKECE